VAQYALVGANAGLKRREAQITEASLTDTLTGLGNRRRLDQALAIEVSRVARGNGVLSAVMLDVDHFKRINDQYGHGAGDEVLAGIGAILGSQTRQTDMPARFGGEEFVVLMPHVTLVQATAKAELLRAQISAEAFAPLQNVTTASFGVAELAPGEDAESFFGRMDKALYQAKESGRNRVVAAPAVHDSMD
jgi:diguanylate cyclase (GGDEF)-like protein